MTRKESNKEIIKVLEYFVNNCPDSRFGQLLINLDILTLTDNYMVKDPYNDESKDTLNKIKNSNLYKYSHYAEEH